MAPLKETWNGRGREPSLTSDEIKRVDIMAGWYFHEQTSEGSSPLQRPPAS